MSDTMAAPGDMTGAEWVASRPLYLTECIECGAPLPKKGESGYAANKKYCDEHGRKDRRATAKTDKMPPSVKAPVVNIQVGAKAKTGPKSAEADKYEQGALRIIGYLGVGFAVVNDQECLAAINAAAPAIAQQLAVLATYHPGLAKVLSPAESTGEAMAWAALFMAASPAIVAILVHHNLLPAKVASALSGVMAGGAVAASAAG